MKAYFLNYKIYLFVIVLLNIITKEGSPQPWVNTVYTNLIYLRLELTTTSDWTILNWDKFSQIRTMRMFAVEGAQPDFQIFYNRVKLTKPTDENLKAKLLVDYVLEVNSEETWQFTLLKGTVGYTEVRLLVKDGFSFKELFSFKHDSLIYDDQSENKLTKKIEFKFESGMKYVPPRVVFAEIPKMILAFYYLWYTKDNWNIFPLKDEPEKIYTSSDETEISKQIKLAKSNGIDGFITSWDSPGSYSDLNFKKLLKLCNKEKFKTSIYYETLASNGPRDENEIYNSLKYIIKNYGSNSAFIKILGRPLIFIWASNEIILRKWNRIINRLKVDNLEANFIAMGYDISNLEVFDGLHQYGVILIDKLDKEFSTLSKIVKNYSLFNGKRKIWTATVQPGYDERNIPNRPGFFKDRNSGKYYEETWKAAIKSEPDLILITSWNEWWEHTHIEPSKKFGKLYLDITRKYSRYWKSK